MTIPSVVVDIHGAMVRLYAGSRLATGLRGEIMVRHPAAGGNATFACEPPGVARHSYHRHEIKAPVAMAKRNDFHRID